MLFISLHDQFPLPATTPPEELVYSVPVAAPQFLKRTHTSYPLTYEYGKDRVFQNVGY
jgi:hypothetical protein